MKKLCASFNNMGWVYFLMGSHEESEKYYKAAINKIRYAPPSEQVRIYNNIASLYYTKGLLDSSVYYFQKSFSKYKNNLAKKQLENIIGSLGNEDLRIHNLNQRDIEILSVKLDNEY